MKINGVDPRIVTEPRQDAALSLDSISTNGCWALAEANFLSDMPAALGNKAMAALERIRDALGLDYAGIDLGLSPDGELLLFEANATMVIVPPDPDERWAYRRPRSAEYSTPSSS